MEKTGASISGHKLSHDEGLSRLRHLILQEDEKRLAQLKEELDSLQERIADKKVWLTNLNPVLLEALATQGNERTEEMAEALAPVMGPAISHQIKEAQEDVIDALYPVIGRTIRKSVSEAIKNLANAINEKVDRALRFNSISRKIKSRLSGVSESDLVLKNVLPLRVEEVFLIHKDTGILLAHVSRTEKTSEPHQEVVSGMLTAIRDFAGSAFGKRTDGELQEIQYDDLSIFIESGRHQYIACVFSGTLSDHMLTKIKRIERTIHRSHAKKLRNFIGQTSDFEDCDLLLKRLLLAEETGKQAASSWPVFAIAALLLILVAVPAFKYVTKSEEAKASLTFWEIPKALEERLAGQTSVDFNKLRFLIDGDVMTLQGQVTTDAERLLIAQTAAGFAETGVIVNDLTVTDAHEDNLNTIRDIKINFGPGGAEITGAGLGHLTRIAALLRQSDFDILEITGHTDNAGSEQLNSRISLERAKNVRDLLIKNGVSGEKMIVAGRGALSPVATNDTPENRSLNRRVEFNFLQRYAKTGRLQ